MVNGEDRMEELAGAISQIQPGALIRNNGLGISEENIEEHAQEITEWAKSLGLDQENTESDTGENSEIQTAEKAIPEKTVRFRQQLMGRWMRGHARPSICGRKEICLQRQSIRKTMAVMQMIPTSAPRRGIRNRSGRYRSYGIFRRGHIKRRDAAEF